LPRTNLFLVEYARGSPSPPARRPPTWRRCAWLVYMAHGVIHIRYGSCSDRATHRVHHRDRPPARNLSTGRCCHTTRGLQPTPTPPHRVSGLVHRLASALLPCLWGHHESPPAYANPPGVGRVRRTRGGSPLHSGPVAAELEAHGANLLDRLAAEFGAEPSRPGRRGRSPPHPLRVDVLVRWCWERGLAGLRRVRR